MRFDKDRFVNFARYDLAINRKFYRNLTLGAVAAMVGVAVWGFMYRWLLWSNYATEYELAQKNPAAYTGNWDDMVQLALYVWNCTGTGWTMLMCFGLMMTIFTGCWAHNLCTKQGRIIELTLPATNLEKFVWHVGLATVGGAALLTLSYLLADAIHALLCLIAMPKEVGVPSLTAWLFNSLLRFTPYEAFLDIRLKWGILFAVAATALLHHALYLLGNALKYRYNLVLTYVAEQVVGGILALVTVTTGIYCIECQVCAYDTPEAVEATAESLLLVWLYAAAIIETVCAALSVWWSYRLYTKAQLTSSWNK